jgi:hypothetical protein
MPACITTNSPGRTINLARLTNGTAPIAESFLHSKFRLDVESSLLRKDKHIAVVTAESSVRHRSIGGVHVDSEAFFGRRISISCYCFQALNKVYFFVVGRQLERQPAVRVGRVFHVCVIRGKPRFDLLRETR